jgi:predicted N-acetyltransferase YhbS
MVMRAASYERRLTGWIKSLNGPCRIARFNPDEPRARWPERLERMVAFRRAEPTDVDAVLAFWAESAEDTARPVDTSAAVERLIARDPDALLLAVDDGKIVGSIIAGWDGWRCHLYRLAVDPRRRGEGLGRAPFLDSGRFQPSGAVVALGEARALDGVDPNYLLGWGAWQEIFGFRPA